MRVDGEEQRGGGERAPPPRRGLAVKASLADLPRDPAIAQAPARICAGEARARQVLRELDVPPLMLSLPESGNCADSSSCAHPGGRTHLCL